ncbi:hypothetical protein GHT06_005853 [Daphnia sinensis]|uniref:Uncharacterized protein n=1 Tax=Daphnia sinensis TaxID=1820382 RepID=A0AAD5KFX1_9CRUS|nr:hypothetical protein GHT06_005853 [Daphnia sinensis]
MFRLIVTSLLALFLLVPSAAFNATVCNCDNAVNLGFLKTDEGECEYQAAPTPPKPITYAVYSTLPEVKRFAGHTCSMWEVTTTVYKDFWQWNQVSHSRKPIEIDAAMCRRMRDSRQCRGKAMDIIGPETFALEGYPFVETSWLQTTTEKMTNCRLEEVTLQTECPNCTISSPLGDIPGAISGSFKHNLVTLVWEDSWKESKPCELRLVEKVGASVSVLQCTAQNVTFETVFTSCGAQPKIGNQTISVEGWELTKYSECYWHANFVNFNGKAHTFKNNTWTPINPTLITHGRRLIDAAPLEVDNSLGMIMQLHPTVISHPLAPSKIMADILAYIQMGYVTEMSGERHVDTILVHPGQADDISFTARMGRWLRNFGALSGIGVSIALAFRFCGLGSWLTPPQSIRHDIELAPQVNPGTAPSAPVTIVNIPTPSAPAGVNVPTRPGMTYQPPPTAHSLRLAQQREAAALLLQSFFLHFMDDRKNQKGGRAAWIPDSDEEDILYYADYSSDLEEFQYVPACPDGEEDILYCADDPYADEVMYDADVSGDTDGASLFSVADNWEGNSFSSCTSTIILDPAALLQDRASPYCLSPASDIQERGIHVAALNDSIARLRGEQCNVSVVSSHYSLDSDEEDLAMARYVERTYRLPSQRGREYRCPAFKLEGSQTDTGSEEGGGWPRSSTPKPDRSSY